VLNTRYDNSALCTIIVRTTRIHCTRHIVIRDSYIYIYVVHTVVATVQAIGYFGIIHTVHPTKYVIPSPKDSAGPII
jgi:hypothetical protein